MAKRFVVTGASGFIGVQLVPRLKAIGFELLLVGREPAQLTHVFPDIPNCSYDDLTEKASDYDALIHLAVLNNDVQANSKDFFRVNVDLLSQVVSSAKTANIRYFVNITTFQAIGDKRTPYANSKRKALKILEKESDIHVVNIFMPAVYGDEFAGKLSVLKKAPTLIRPIGFILLAAIVPTLHVDRLSSFIAEGVCEGSRNVFLADPQEQNPVYGSVKRIIDLLFSVAVIGLFGWLLFIVWLLVLTTSSGPGIFAQERIGKNRKAFTCYKFRTMKQGTKQAGTHEIPSGAVTRIGSILRKTKFDELPQVWNILRGDLSLVGPRPCLPVQEDLIKAREQLDALSVKPGITGLAQINGIDMVEPLRLARMDALYIARRGLLLEIEIIVSTLLGQGQGDGVR